MPEIIYYRPKNFIIQELVDPQTYKDRGDLAWELLHGRMLYMLDVMVDFFGEKPTINNWHIKGQYKDSGYRPIDCKTGAKHSMHRQGGGFDTKWKKNKNSEVYTKIKNNPEVFIYIICLEDIKFTETWVHADDRNFDTKNGIKIVKP